MSVSCKIFDLFLFIMIVKTKQFNDLILSNILIFLNLEELIIQYAHVIIFNLVNFYFKNS